MGAVAPFEIRIVMVSVIATSAVFQTEPAEQLKDHIPDLADWDCRPHTQRIPEKSAAACPYVGGCKLQPRNPRTLRRWRGTRRGPSYLKIGGQYFYTIGALRDFYERSIRGGDR
jgi:hypothetical protein